jgi:hypothetical protein
VTGNSAFSYKELDPAKKNAAWGNGVITLLRRDWRRLNNVSRAINDRSTLYSVNEIKDIKESFDDEDFKKRTAFLPLPILEPMINSVVEEITRNPPKAKLKAIDPTSIVEKKEDLNLLANRSILENDRSELHSRVGLPPYKLGQENFNGNVQDFDKLGLDSNDPDDITFYEKNLQKLKSEVAGQSVIDAIFKNSRFDKELIRRLVKDVFALKTICVQKYVDRITGEIKDRYVDPANAFGIFGKTNDGKDDICRGWQDSITVMQWLELVGDEFNFQRDWKFLLWGINYCNSQQWTGFIRNGVPFECCGDVEFMGKMGMNEVTESRLMDWSMAYTYKVYVGYIEWRSPEATSTFSYKKVVKDGKEYQQDVMQIPYSKLLEEKEVRKGYQKESRYQIPWYSSYFIATTSVSQWIWGFGKVYMQNTYGANDEYSNGTLCYYQEEGLSAVEISKQYLHVANFTFYRMLWVIYKAKPDPDEFVFDELLQLAGTVQRQLGQGSSANLKTPGLEGILNDIITQQRKKHIRLRTYPRIDGRAVNQIHPIEQKGRGGLDPIALSMQAVCQWAENNIASKIGINPLRLGGNPQARESKDSEDATVNYSLQTTGYIYRMIQYLKEHSAICSLNYAQDIIKYKDSAPYKWLMTIVGAEAIQDLKILDKFAQHRCGLFIEDTDDLKAKEDIRAAAAASLQQKEIDIVQYYQITSTDDVGKAVMTLGRFKEKAAKQAQQFELDKMKTADDYAQKQHQREMEKMKFERDTKFGVADRESNAFIASAQVNKEGKIQTQELKDANHVAATAEKTKGEIEKDKAKSNLEQQQPLQS